MSINATVLSLLPSSSTGSTVSALLGAIYGTSSTAQTQDVVSALKSAEANETQDVAAQAAQPETARDIAAYKSALAKAKTPADLLSDPQALKVLLTANGLGDQADYPALAQKALLSDTTQTGNLASQLSDTQWLATAKAYDFANQGLAVVQSPTAVESVTSGYAEVQWRTSLDASTPGLSNALTFRSEASGITSVDQILGDSTLRTVVTTALGIPEQIAFQPLEAQEKAITDKLDISKFQDPNFVEQFARRYLLTNQETQSGTSTDTSSASVASSLLA